MSSDKPPYNTAHPDLNTPYEVGHFLFDIPPDEDSILSEIVHIIEQHLGEQPRTEFPPGFRFTIEGERASSIAFLLSGSVALERSSEAGEVIMHRASTGHVVGLLSLINHGEAFFTAVAVEPVTAIRLTFEQVQTVAHHNRRMAELLAVMLIRSFNKRLLRSEDIQIEKIELSKQLAEERAHLAQALRDLEGARAELIAQARYASLGELAAGVAHELNNPMAAIQRTADYLKQDVHDLLATCTDQEWAHTAEKALTAAINAHVLPTKELRALKKQLIAVTNDPHLAQRLVVAGVYDVDLAAKLAYDHSPLLEAVEQAAAIGTNVRNLATASQRIVELVASLRSYARPDGDPVADVNIHEGLEDTLRLLNHKLRGITIERDYGELPHVSCHPGQLAQVWTNVITNAAESMQDAAPEGAHEFGTITIRTSTCAPNNVQVQISDTGPGIPPDVVHRIFEPRFTTKGGQVRFGMGIGLSVCRSIMTQHNGSIDLTSTPNGAVATIRMPVGGPLSHPHWAQNPDITTPIINEML